MVCPPVKVMSLSEFDSISLHKPHVLVHGIIYDISALLKIHTKNGATTQHLNHASGKDMSHLFPWDPKLHPFLKHSYQIGQEGASTYVHDRVQYEKLTSLCSSFVRAFSLDEIRGSGHGQCALVVIEDLVYSAEMALKHQSGLSENAKRVLRSARNCEKALNFKYINAHRDIKLLERYFQGILEYKSRMRCRYVSFYHLLCSGMIVIFIGLKLLAVCLNQLRSNSLPSSRPTIILVSCYAENEDTVKDCVTSIASLQIDKDHALLFMVIDGVVPVRETGQLNVEAIFSALGRTDYALDEGGAIFEYCSLRGKQHAKIFCGIYIIRNERLPYVLVLKLGCGKANIYSGNCGKRDSQLILLQTLSKIRQNEPLTDFENELVHSCLSVSDLYLDDYEYILMVDADTEVAPPSVGVLTRRFLENDKIIGMCGETRVKNECTSWVTSVQVFEYFISFNLTKAFESLFGMVTCLPGCFSMYRILGSDEHANMPLIIKPELLRSYAETRNFTVHQKNLLDLGEDRYLTTLLIKFFPNARLEYSPEAWCLTHVPETFRAFLNQRRRWINSTVHNLVELIGIPIHAPIRFVVLCDLFSTVISPASVIYTFFLIFQSYNDSISLSPALILLLFMYGLQAFIFIRRGTWSQLFWLLCNILAFPVTGLILPLYAFWNFDNYTWNRNIESVY